jgi:hypothetical protein
VAVRWDEVSWARVRLPGWFFPHGGVGVFTQGYLRTEVFGPGRVWVFDVFAPSWHPFAAFWNGRSWERRPLPMSPLAVSALSPGNMWVVGESGLAVSVNGGRTGPLREAARHWDGRRWDLALIPGTRSVLAAGTTGPPIPARSGHPAGVILEHRP